MTTPLEKPVSAHYRRFLIFGGEDHPAPLGGAHDFLDHARQRGNAIAKAEDYVRRERGQSWAHVYDQIANRIIFEAAVRPDGSFSLTFPKD